MHVVCFISKCMFTFEFRLPTKKCWTTTIHIHFILTFKKYTQDSLYYLIFFFWRIICTPISTRYCKSFFYIKIYMHSSFGKASTDMAYENPHQSCHKKYNNFFCCLLSKSNALWYSFLLLFISTTKI